MHVFSSFTAQVWDGETLVSCIEGLSIDAAREICRCAPMGGMTGRVWCDDKDEDYTEVFAKDGTVRRGAFADTTIVVRVEPELPGRS